MKQEVINLLKMLHAMFLPGTNMANILRLIFVSTVVAVFFLFASNYSLPGGAWQFVEYATALSNHTHLAPQIAQRDIGFPLLIWLSGYNYNHSLLGLTILQTLMAIAIPIICYLSVRPWFPKVAYYCGLAVIATLSPFYFMKWIHHDQIFIFFNVLSVSLLITYIHQKKTIFLYAMTFTVIMASLARPAGNLFFPLFIAIAYFYVRGGVVKYLINISLVVLIFSLYSYHRYQIFEIGKYEAMPSYTGKQVFYNLYINSKEYDLHLSPDIGPAMKKITQQVSDALSPSPAASAQLKAAEPEYFLKEFFYPYTTKELINQLFINPNWEYYAYMCDENIPDKLFLLASLEIFHKYPWYPFAYTARNVWHLLYDPGYAHTRYNAQPFSLTGIQNAFMLEGFNSKQYVTISKRGADEIAFDTNEYQSHFISHLYHEAKKSFILYYSLIAHYVFYLMAIAWVPVIVQLLNFFVNSKLLNRMAALLEVNKITPPIVAITAVLMECCLITGMFAEPDFRYHHFLIPIKIILASFGVGVFLLALRKVFFNTADCIGKHGEVAVGRSYYLPAMGVAIFVAAMFYWWCSYMIRHTV